MIIDLINKLIDTILDIVCVLLLIVILIVIIGLCITLYHYFNKKKLLLPIIEGLFLYKSNIKITNDINHDCINVNDVVGICNNLLELNQYYYQNYSSYNTFYRQLFLDQWQKIYRYVTLKTTDMLKARIKLNELIEALKTINIELPAECVKFEYVKIYEMFYNDTDINLICNNLSKDQIISWCTHHCKKEYYSIKFTYKLKYYYDNHMVDPIQYTIQDKINLHNILCIDLIKYYLSSSKFSAENVDEDIKKYLNKKEEYEQCLNNILEEDKREYEKYNQLFERLSKIAEENELFIDYDRNNVSEEIISELQEICKKLKAYHYSDLHNIRDKNSKFSLQNLWYNYAKKNTYLYNQISNLENYNKHFDSILKLYNENKYNLTYEFVKPMTKASKYLRYYYNNGLLLAKHECGYYSTDEYYDNNTKKFEPSNPRQRALKIVHLKNDMADSIIRKSTIYYLFNDIKKYYNKYKEKPENNNSGIFKIQAEGLKLQYKQVEKLNAVVKALVFKDNI